MLPLLTHHVKPAGAEIHPVLRSQASVTSGPFKGHYEILVPVSLQDGFPSPLEIIVSSPAEWVPVALHLDKSLAEIGQIQEGKLRHRAAK